jgi:hypothetical protein
LISYEEEQVKGSRSEVTRDIQLDTEVAMFMSALERHHGE